MDRSHDERGLGRRKACDFCCQKKIRCDAKKPQCSGCALHNIACVWTAAVRPQKSVPRQTPAARVSEHRFETIEDRLRAIEAHIWRTDSNAQAASGPNADNTTSEVIVIDQDDHDMAESPGHDSPASRSPNVASIPEIPLVPEEPTTLAGVDSRIRDAPSVVAIETHTGKRSKSSITRPNLNLTPGYPLPDRFEIGSVIDGFFEEFNRTTPLFIKTHFMKMFNEFYDCPETRDKVKWSAINVVMALGLYISRSKGNSTDSQAAMFIKMAQSAMDKVVYRDQDLLGLQIVLGITIFFMHTAHPHPACVLIATAVKLVYRLKLNLPPQTAEHRRHAAERARLFWLTYTLDRDLSLRTSEPYLIQDHDIGIEVDKLGNGAGRGCVTILPDFSPDEPFDPYEVKRKWDLAEKINVPKTRARLAFVQGKIYDNIYSFRAMAISASEKRRAVDDLERMLEEWYTSLPPSFKTSSSTYATSVHITYCQCLFSIRRVSIHNTDWIKLLHDFPLTTSEQNIDTAESASLLPPNSLKLVEFARFFLRLLTTVNKMDTATRWSSTCACEAAITMLSANLISRAGESPSVDHRQADAEADYKKIEVALEEFKDRVQGSDDRFVNSMYTECKALGDKAALAVQAFMNKAS